MKNNLFTKKISKQTIKNILIILGFVIVLLLGIYIGKLLNKQKEGFAIEDTGFFSSDAIIAIKEMDLNNITTTIENNKTAIDKINENMGKNVIVQGTIIPYYPKNTTDSTKLSVTDITYLLLKGFVVCDKNSYTIGNTGTTDMCSIEIIDNFIVIKKGDTEIAKVPDLSRRFVVGAGVKSSDADNDDENNDDYNIGTTGGEDKHKLTSDESGLVSHTHTMINGGTHSHSGNTNYDGSHTHNIKTYKDDGRDTNLNAVASAKDERDGIGHMKVSTYTSGNHRHSFTISSSGSHNHEINNNTAEDAEQAHENRPPFMAMVYIYYLGDEYRYYETIPEEPNNEELYANATFMKNLYTLLTS